MSNLFMLVILSAILIASFFLLAMLMIKMKFDLQEMYDKYQFERVKRLDERRKYEMKKRPHTTRSEYLTKELFDDVRAQFKDKD